MSTFSITDTGRSAAPSAAPTAPTPTVRQSTAAAPAVTVDEVTQQPLPPRFPWLSRLSQELGAASNQPPAFPAAPVLGDRLDKQA